MLFCGVDVIDGGIVPTPTNYFSMYEYDFDGAVQQAVIIHQIIMGLSLSFNKKAFYGKQIQELKNIILNNKFIKAQKGTLGKNIIPDYKKMLLKKIKISYH